MEAVLIIWHSYWKFTKNGEDFYPTIRQLAAEKPNPHPDSVRFELLKRFGYYITESSEHNAEYHPYFIKSKIPKLIDELGIPLDEYYVVVNNKLMIGKACRRTLCNGELTYEKP